MKKFLIWLIPVLVILFLCAGFTALNYTQKKDSIDYQKSFKSTTAVVVDKHLIIDTNGDYAITFNYKVDGKAYSETIYTKQRSSRLSRIPNFARTIYHVGDVTTIWYDPADPSIMRGGQPSPWLDIFMPMIIGMTIVIFFSAAMLRTAFDKKSKKKSKDSKHRDYDDDDDDDDDD